MGVLHYGPTELDIADADLVTLQFAVWKAFARDITFHVELRRPADTIWLVFSPGVPLAFVVNNVEPVHRGADLVARWEDEATGGGCITIDAFPDDSETTA
ncbi:MAG: hypothetical protein J0I40_04260 [Cellulomonas sp.]|uniref:hypothetical protein n=1 Tax=Cellulomonas sp. 73-92 TaxID=1895740 RepID=UPI00092C01B6|nr:hypothetical protein [Cellulomonas sp. 73-92]MBN9374603.1 hypothetical protein [Cellulomonas sp.]OJV76479.1 MAG: hypothetical protein BGO37_10495 [Cellulomonas sp. 73-92]